MKIIKTIIYILTAENSKGTKMERKLQLLETYSSRSQETHPYFVENKLDQNNFHFHLHRIAEGATKC